MRHADPLAKFDETMPELFRLRSPVANADPMTSHQSAAEVVESGRQARNVAKVAWLVSHCPGRTSRELACTTMAVTAEMDRYECARRLPEAEQAGLVRRGPVRKCRESQKNAITWLPANTNDGENDTGVGLA